MGIRVRFNLISNLTNGVGLQQDYTLLRHQLLIRGHTVQGVQFNGKPLQVLPADVNIFLEVVNPLVFRAAPKQWAVPNPEWWFAAWDQYSWDLVLAKTHDCERIFTEKVGDRCQYVGWTARNLYNPAIGRQRTFLHVAGKSQFKNTPAVIAGCQRAKVPLLVVSEHVGLRRRVPQEELIYLMNSHFCHVMPSAYEGYGQVLHEALGVGQVIITTDAPPMNEMRPAFMIPSSGWKKHHEGQLHKVSVLDVSTAVNKVKDLTDERLTALQEEARAEYRRGEKEFQQALDALVGRA